MSNRKQEQALINLLWDSENANYFRSQPNPEETWHNAPEFVIRKSIPYSNRSKKQNIGQVRTNSNTLCLYKSSQLKRAALNPKKSQSARTATPDKRQRSPMNLNTEAQEQHRGSFSAAVREIKGIEDRQKARRYIIKQKLSRLINRTSIGREVPPLAKGDQEKRKQPISYSRYLKEKKEQTRLSHRVSSFNYDF